MKKGAALKLVNPILFLVFILQALTGIFRARLPYELFAVIHPVGGYVLCGLVALHLALNWSWITGTLFRRPAAPARPARGGV